MEDYAMKKLLLITFGVLILAGCSNPFGIADDEWSALSSEQKAHYRKEFYYYKADRKMPTYSEPAYAMKPVASYNPYYQNYNTPHTQNVHYTQTAEMKGME